MEAGRQSMARHLPSVRSNPDAESPPPKGRGRAPNVLLTEAEIRIVAAVEDLSLEKGYAPTLGEIADRVGWTSTGSVSQYLDRLRSQGVIEGRGRSLRIKD